MRDAKLLITAVLVFVSPILQIQCVSVDTDFTFSRDEISALAELKPRVYDILPQDYMRTDLYLINWIRAGDLDVNKAEKLLLHTLKWRAEKNIDKLLYEDFSYLQEEMPIDIDGVDYTGKPVVVIRVADWDIRRLHVLGESQQVYRYTVAALETASQKVREAQKRGERVTKFQVIFDLRGFNIQQHSQCTQCIPQYIQIVKTLGRHYPGMVDNIIFINVISKFEEVVKFLRPMAKERLPKVVKLFGTDKKQWKTFLLSIIPSDQLDSSLGGTKIIEYI